jgi:hypothetical protein
MYIVLKRFTIKITKKLAVERFTIYHLLMQDFSSHSSYYEQMSSNIQYCVVRYASHPFGGPSSRLNKLSLLIPLFLNKSMIVDY